MIWAPKPVYRRLKPSGYATEVLVGIFPYSLQTLKMRFKFVIFLVIYIAGNFVLQLCFFYEGQCFEINTIY